MTGSSEEEGEEDKDNRKLRGVCQSLWIFIIKDLEINVNEARALTATPNRKISRRIFNYFWEEWWYLYKYVTPTFTVLPIALRNIDKGNSSWGTKWMVWEWGTPLSICNVVLSSSTLISLPSLFKPMKTSLSVIEGSYALIAVKWERINSDHISVQFLQQFCNVWKVRK